MKPSPYARFDRMPRWKIEASNRMRHNPTPAEAVLWARLAHRQLEGTRWRRQKPMFGYIADFLCPAHALVVEVDGGYHRADVDARRDTALAAHGFRTLRVSNQDVMENLDSVIERIRAALP